MVQVLLDPAIRNWVMLPVLVLVVLVTFSRMYAMKLLSPPPEGASPPDKKGLKERAIVAQSQRLRANGGYISQRGWAMRKEYLIGKDGKLLDKDVKDPNPMSAMSGPGSMDTMKIQVLNMFFNFGIGMLVSVFFTGFVTLRLPFSLTERFKAITQQGVGVPGLESSFVSTMSWWYICQFGLGMACFRLLSKGVSSAEEQAQMQGMYAMSAPGMGQAPPTGFMTKTLYGQEAEAQKILEWAPTPLLVGERALLEVALAKGLAPVAVSSMKGGGGVGGGGGAGRTVAAPPSNPALKKAN